ncbi:MAG: hypothetical protein KF757_11990 [Phycisphaeraceae bacterium]|nr:hypothetical protein [Phycisphaeraceae bacterium]MCW5762413.1 hypothetical protein [Phycisphaeraceae bacterium]
MGIASGIASAMSWQEFWLDAIELLGLGGTLGAAVGAAVTLVVQAKLSRKTESLRRIDEQRIKVLSAVYAALQDMHDALQDFASPDAAGDEAARRERVFQSAANAFRMKWQRSSFLFNKTTIASFDEIWNLYKDTGYALDDARTGLDVQKRQYGRSLLQNKIAQARLALDEKIRALIGIF